ncbi:MAG TPA: arginine N-succinyltransferase [Myxococcales bacterium]|nr:arginine N-succinyltransferase [Myxococcales bacterium]
MFVIRDVQRQDLDGLKKLAAVLNSVNLPDDEKVLEAIVDKSIKSFSSRIRLPLERQYLFVLEETRTGRLVGTSMIIAQHGTREAPHAYFEVGSREHYSATLDKHFKHVVLSIGYNYEGPTEIGGLVVDPSYRGQGKPGKQLSYARFLFIAMHRRKFRERVLAELLPPLLPDGRSLLWEACGRKFTGLTYHEADSLSRQNKEFIKELFPQTDIYATLFHGRVQKVIGKVGQDTEPVQRMLERIGFKYVERIDPFDGGPHFEAEVKDVSLVRDYRTVRLAEQDLGIDFEPRLVAHERPAGKNRFRAVRAPCRIDGDEAAIPTEAREALGAAAGDRVHVIPFD